MNALDLARIQFAANISFHILFPSISIALAWILVFFKIAYQRSHSAKWLEAYQFWVKIFALCFALGVVSGITMSFQFGTNWPGFMTKVSNVAGPLLAYEVLSAFFLEATFLGIMLFGFRRVSPTTHTVATVLVALGTLLSAFWIMVLNAWMQAPRGYQIVNGVLYPSHWLGILFNPSVAYRFWHMVIASGLTAAFLVAGISAYRWLRQDRSASVLAVLKTGIYLAAVLMPLQLGVGDLLGLDTLKHQPEKIAAIEGIWQTGEGLPWHIFAWPDAKSKRNDFVISIPYGSSLLLTHHRDGKITGLDAFAEHPPVAPLFFGFRLMLMIGGLMFFISWLGVWLLRKEKCPAWFAKSLVCMTFSGWIATLAGWYVTEIGRQPWLVHGILKTQDAVASNVGSGMILSTLVMYLSLYGVLILSFISVLFYLARKAAQPNLKPALNPKPV